MRIAQAGPFRDVTRATSVALRATDEGTGVDLPCGQELGNDGSSCQPDGTQNGQGNKSLNKSRKGFLD